MINTYIQNNKKMGKPLPVVSFQKKTLVQNNDDNSLKTLKAKTKKTMLLNTLYIIDHFLPQKNCSLHKKFPFFCLCLFGFFFALFDIFL